jgi:hypothetical protein
MGTLRRQGFSRRTLILLTFLLAAGTSMMLVPKRAWAVCCGFETDTTYFSGPDKGTPVGYCDRNVGCSGTDDCPGPTTPYFTISHFCCEQCGN